MNITPPSTDSVRNTEEYKPKKRLGKTEITKHGMQWLRLMLKLGLLASMDYTMQISALL